MFCVGTLTACSSDQVQTAESTFSEQLPETENAVSSDDYVGHWAEADIISVVEHGYADLDEKNNFYLDEEMSASEFYDWVNAAALYTASEPETEGAITRAEAAELLALYMRIAQDYTEEGADFSDVDATDEYANAVGAMNHYNVLSDLESVSQGNFEPDRALTRGEAASMLHNATVAVLSVEQGSNVLIRETQECIMDAAAVSTENDMLVDKSIIGLMGGAEVPEESQTVTPAENEIVVHFSQDQQVLAVNDNNMISLRQLVEAYDGTMELQEENGSVTGATFEIDRPVLKSNRNLNDKELALEYAKFYLRYTETPLPERPDEIAWNEKKELYAVSAKKADDTILNPNTYSQLLDPDFVPEEGWSSDSDGIFTTMCAIVDMNFPEGTEVDNADMISSRRSQ